VNDRSPPSFPFSAVVGQDDVKLALLLTAVDRRIGGVVLRGEKGSAKTTLARALAALLAEDAPFVELPVSASEDRVIGSLDLGAALTRGVSAFHPGLLADADGGVLYVDEVNLLPDHIVDVLLDVAVSGVNRVEREAVSRTHPSRFVLVGSMNPEEGELRPQLLDRFGLAVDVTASRDPDERVEAVQRRMAFDQDPEAFAATWAPADGALGARLAATVPADVPADLLRRISQLCVAVGCEGLRADLVVTRAAAAHAGWHGRGTATVDDVAAVAPMALAHRRRHTPLDDPGIDREEIERALDRGAHSTSASEGPSGQDGDGSQPDGDGSQLDDGGSDLGEGQRETSSGAGHPPVPVVHLGAARSVAPDTASGRRSTVQSTRGRLIGDRDPDAPLTHPEDIALGATVRRAAARRAAAEQPGARYESSSDPSVAMVQPTDLRRAVREQRAGNLLVIAVDASASMGVEQRMAAVKGAVSSLLVDAYQRRDRVAVVTFAGAGAEVVLRPTASTEIARARMSDLATGGRTPLAAGIDAAVGVARGAPATHRPYLIVVSDGRATAAAPGQDPLEAAMASAVVVRRLGIPSVVLDVETGRTRLGLAQQLADAMGARHLPLPDLSAGTLTSAIRSRIP